MTGSPLDGAPWWVKVVVYAVYAPIAAVDKIKDVAGKFKRKNK